MPIKRSDERGDLYLTVNVTFPEDGWLETQAAVDKVRAVLPEGVQSRALLVPQRAVGRDERGRATVLVVGAGNKAESRVLTTGRTQGDSWIVTGGLVPGDKVIVEGGMLLRPGAPVTPHPMAAQAR